MIGVLMVRASVTVGAEAETVTAEATTLDAWLDGIALVLILAGALLCVTAALGLVRFQDVPTRLHAATKPQVLGVVLVCIAVALALRSWAALAFLVPVVLIQLATSPLAAQMVGRQAYRNGTIENDLLVDELGTHPAPESRRDATTDAEDEPGR